MALKKFSFNVIKTDNYSRRGIIKTHRGNICTPAFMPVGTQATVKAAFIKDINVCFYNVMGLPLAKFYEEFSVLNNIK